MAVKKRKSNWYIYVITFLIALGIAVLAVQSMEGLLFPEKSSDALNYEAVSYLPSEANNMTTLVMLSEMKAGTPDLYMIVGYLHLLEETHLLFLQLLKIYHAVTSTMCLLLLLYNRNVDTVLPLL